MSVLALQPRSVTFRADGSPIIHFWPFGAGFATQFHQIDPARGLISRTWGRELTPEQSRPGEYLRIIGAGPNDHVWSAHSAAYQVDEWDAGGTKKAVVTRSPAWFRPLDVTASRQSAPYTVISAVRQGSDHLLWVLIAVPRDENLFASGEAHGAVDLSEAARRWDTVVEVIDLEAGVVTARHRFQGIARAFLGDGHTISTIRESPTGLIVADVWRLTLQSPSSLQ